MYFFDLCLDSLAENLALDEALLVQAEAGGLEVLRIWEWPTLAVVLGAGCRLAEDVYEDACRVDGVPILRRGSGGGAVLLGPGCLVYSLVLAQERAPQMRNIQSSFTWILQRLAELLEPLGFHLSQAGTSDLVMGNVKFGGSAQQRKSRHLLHHGTLLYGFDLTQVERYLRMPVRQPEYRQQRPHRDFLGNLPVQRSTLCEALRRGWSADQPLADRPRSLVARLVEEKYGQESWIHRHAAG